MIRSIVLSTGYAESSSVGWLIFSIDHGYECPKTAREAFTSLTKYLYLKFLKDHPNSVPKLDGCCKRTIKKDAEAKFCSRCAKSVEKQDFDIESFQEYISSMTGMDCDSFGYDDDLDIDHAWVHYDFDFTTPTNELVIVPVYAERMIGRMLYEIYPELFEKKPLSEWLEEEFHKLFGEEEVYVTKDQNGKLEIRDKKTGKAVGAQG